jgi:Family of unknown function (DUF5675)
MYRRTFLVAALTRSGFAQLNPFKILIQREERWPNLMNLSQCILRKLCIVRNFPSFGDPIEKPIGSTLELPWRNNLEGVSRISAGLYKAKTRTDGSLGWRLELDPVTDRRLIEIHIGNFPKNSTGCILLGSGRSASDGCTLTDSGLALKELGARYGTTARPIEVLIKDA